MASEQNQFSRYRLPGSASAYQYQPTHPQPQPLPQPTYLLPQAQPSSYCPIGYPGNFQQPQSNGGIQKLQFELASVDQVPRMLWPSSSNSGLLMSMPPAWDAGFTPMAQQGPFGIGTQATPAAYPPAGPMIGWELESIVEPGISGSLVRYFNSALPKLDNGVLTSEVPEGNTLPVTQQFQPTYSYAPEHTGNWMSYPTATPIQPISGPPTGTQMNMFAPLERSMLPISRSQSQRQLGQLPRYQHDFGDYDAFRRNKMRRNRAYRRGRSDNSASLTSQEKLVSDNTVTSSSAPETESQEVENKENIEPETSQSSKVQSTTEDMDSGIELIGRLWSSVMEEDSKESEIEAEEAVQSKSSVPETAADVTEQPSSSSNRQTISKYVKHAGKRTSRGNVVDMIVKEMKDLGFTHYIRGSEFPYVSNMLNLRVINQIKYPPRQFSYYVPPRVDDDDFFGGQIRIWNELMLKCFSYYSPDLWNLQGLPEFDKSRDDGWMHFSTTTKLRFCCRNCFRPWTSMRGKIHFALKMSPHERRGVIFMKIFGQVCIQENCSDTDFQTPACYPEEIERVLLKLRSFVGCCYYGHPPCPELSDSSLNQTFRSGNPVSPHRPELCQACQQGVCSR